MHPRRRISRVASLALALASASSSCRSTGGADARVFRKPDADWPRYTVVYVEEATASTTAPRNEEVEATLRELKSLAETSLRTALENTRRFEKVTVRKEEIVPGKTLLCRCEVNVHFGSAALRFLVGFGAGRSGLSMTPALHDAATDERILSYQGWGGAMAGWGPQILAKMRNDIPAIANYFAALLPPRP
ncbi:MAG TPA: DUF4410 domain-containing protein [Planctomycetota bacterium]|jgi:hypothetical protein|nr:DUF4410 domain-containing protein [Planctomycetota bacterium]